MRIGVVTGEYPPMQGGIGAYSSILAKELTQQGNNVYVLSGTGAGTDNEAIVTDTVQSWGASSLRAIRNWSVEQRLDIINLQFQTAAFGMSPWIHFLPEVVGKIPLVTTFHDLRYPYLFPKAGRLRDWIVRRLASRSNGVIVTNQEDQQRLAQLSNVTLIPIGSNILKVLPPDFDAHEWRQQAGAKDDDFVLTYFGLYNRSKGLDILLQATANLRQSNIPLRLIMIGGAGTSDPTNTVYAEEIKRTIEQLGLQDHVFQTGFVDEGAVGAYLSASDAIVLPFLDGASYRRGSLMAAIHYQKPIVTTTPQVTVPAFKDGKNMVMVKPGDVGALADAIRRLCESPENRTRLQAGAAKLAELFDWPQIAQDTIEYFRWVIEESA